MGRSRAQTNKTVPAWRLDQPLLRLSTRDGWTIGDSFHGTQVFGATGSGKTSGSGAAIAKAMLRAGYGGLVLCAKDSEADLWRRYAQECGCEGSLLVIDDSGAHRHNFLDAEARRASRGGGMVENLVALFNTVAEVAERRPGAASSRDSYWDDALRQLLRNAFDLMRLADEQITIDAVSAVIASMPKTPEHARSRAWQEQSLLAWMLIRARMRARQGDADAHDLEITARFWLQEFAGLHDKTRSNIVSTFSVLADAFQRGALHRLFSTTTTFGPEVCFDGVVIVVDLPVKLYHEAGRYAQTLMKYVWQRAVEQRPVTPSTRPVFLWVDEAQGFLTRHDTEFQATAREKRAATVFLAQTVSSYYAAVGSGGTHAADSFLANLGTTIFHSSGDAVTNEWAQRKIASTLRWRPNVNASTGRRRRQDRGSRGGGGDSDSASGGASLQETPNVPASVFTTLKSGGPRHDFVVEGIVFQNGRKWKATRSAVIKAEFRQRERRPLLARFTRKG